MSADGRAAGYSGPEGTASQRSTHSEQHGGWVPQHCNRHSMCSNWSRAAGPLTSNSMVEVGSALVTRTTLTALPGMAITCAIRADSPEGRRGTELDLHHTTRDLKKKVQVHHLQLKIHGEIKCRDTAPFSSSPMCRVSPIQSSPAHLGPPKRQLPRMAHTHGCQHCRPDPVAQRGCGSDRS